MRAIVVSGMARPLGGLVHGAQLSAALRARGVETTRYSLLDAEHSVMDGDQEVIRVALFGADRWEDAAQLAGVITERAKGAIEIGHAEDPVAAQALFALREQGLVGAVILTVHHLESEEGPGERLERQALQGADAVVCASTWWAERVTREFGVTPIVVPHGVDVDYFAHPGVTRAVAGAHFGWGVRPVILALGGVQPRKGSRVLLEAFARARARLGADALLVIAGGSAHDEFYVGWSEDAERLGLVVADGDAATDEVNVCELGVVAHDEMPLLYRAADCLVTPSTREGFGLIALEAAASGIPNVLNDLPVFAEHFIDDINCVIVAAGDSGALATGIVRAMRDTELRERIVTNGHILANRLGWDACAGDYLAVYRAHMAINEG